MNKRSKIISGIVVASFALSAFAVSADDTEEPTPAFTWTYNEDLGRLLTINDGRINSWEVAAPVAIYYTHNTVFDDNGNPVPEVTGIELLDIQPETNNGEMVLNASVDDLQTLVDGSADYLEASGYKLYYKDGSFTVVAPADYEGKVYSFTWENEAITLE